MHKTWGRPSAAPQKEGRRLPAAAHPFWAQVLCICCICCVAFTCCLHVCMFCICFTCYLQFVCIAAGDDEAAAAAVAAAADAVDDAAAAPPAPAPKPIIFAGRCSLQGQKILAKTCNL